MNVTDPLPDQSLSDAVAERLRTAITEGVYAPGDHLVERRLARQFGVSHIPLREALARLVEEGLVVRLPRRGVRVASLTPRSLEEVSSLRVVLEQFVVRGVTRTPHRTGVLIFVSLAEHYARIIADDGIAQKVPNHEWQAAIDAMLEHLRAGGIAAGFTAAIEHCGNVLAAHAPPNGSTNELPDRLYVV